MREVRVGEDALVLLKLAEGAWEAPSVGGEGAVPGRVDGGGRGALDGCSMEVGDARVQLQHIRLVSLQLPGARSHDRPLGGPAASLTQVRLPLHAEEVLAVHAFDVNAGHQATLPR